MSDFDDGTAATPEAPPETAPAAARPSIGAWLREGCRSLLFLAPRWPALQTAPALLAGLLLLETAITIAFQRLYIEGAATFQTGGLTAGWTGLILYAWACYALRPDAEQPDNPGPARVLTLLLSQALCLMLVVGPAYIALLRTNALLKAETWVHITIWSVPIAWGTLAALVALLRLRGRRTAQQVAAASAVALALLAYTMGPPSAFWTRVVPEEEEREETLRFTQEMVEEQAPLLEAQLDMLAPQRPGVKDMYTITFAPFEGEEVFRRESRMVSEVMAGRFDARGRGMQLLNHREHLTDMPWATAINLERAIGGIAQVMDKDEDVLFIHLTSHGASDGELAANFWPMDVEPVMPANLRQWLDDAGIRHRVVSISACYAGNWIGPLASEDTLVMTASDATHTSYGCGRKSALTFFGRAMYDEQLRSTTLSFEEAHAAARRIIQKREIEAGKDDGYSNPQIRVGSRIGPYLKQLREQLGTR